MVTLRARAPFSWFCTCCNGKTCYGSWWITAEKLCLRTPLFPKSIYTSLELYKNLCEVLFQLPKKSTGAVDSSSNCSVLHCLHCQATQTQEVTPGHRWSWHTDVYTFRHFSHIFTIYKYEIWLGKNCPMRISLMRTSSHELLAGWLFWINPKPL